MRSSTDSTTTTTRRPRLLLSAFACDPQQGSESGVGWRWTQMLARRYDCWVLTRAEWRERILADPLAHRPGLHWVFIPSHSLLHRLRLRHPLLRYADYLFWQCAALLKAGRLVQAIGIDGLWHLTMNGYRIPGWLALLARRRRPWIWGPIGGVQNAPLALVATAQPGALAAERRRNRINSWSLAHDPWPRWACRRARLLFAANDDAEQWIRRQTDTGRVRRCSELLLADAPREPQPKKRHILWVGSDDDRKGLPIALRIWRQLHQDLPDWSIHIVGPTRVAIDELPRCQVHGRLSLAQVHQHLAAAAIFWFTSWRDTSGNVLLEAMQNGCVPLAIDHQGVPLLCPAPALRVPLTELDELVATFAARTRSLAAASDRRNDLADWCRRQAARHRPPAVLAGIAQEIDACLDH